MAEVWGARTSPLDMAVQGYVFGRFEFERDRMRIVKKPRGKLR